MIYAKFIKHRFGFTVVELLIVIVVISILAAITLVAYNGMQAQARDSSIRTAAENFASAMKRYSIRNGSPTGFGSGTSTAVTNGVCTGGSRAGWAEPTTYACTIGDVMIANDYLPSNFFTELPNNKRYNSPRYVFMFYPCSGGPSNRYQLYYSLENPSDKDNAQYIENGQMCNISSPQTAVYYTSYNMRGSLIVDLD